MVAETRRGQAAGRRQPAEQSHQLSRSILPAKGLRWGWGPPALMKDRARREGRQTRWLLKLDVARRRADDGKPSEERGAKRAKQP